MIKKLGTQLKIAASSAVLEDIVTGKPSVQILEAKKPDFVYFRARAISAGDQGPEQGKPNPNGNGDYFPRTELEKSYQSFIGKNLFLNHESDHPVKSVGKIIDAHAVEDAETGEFYIECFAKIDRKLHPEIARKVETGELDRVSMGCQCTESLCSICGTAIYTDADQKCEHLSAGGLLREFEASVDFPEYGIRKGAFIPAFAINRGLAFNELSIVNVPADSSAIIKTVIANAKAKISKKAALDANEKAHLVTALNQLDEATREKIKAELYASDPKETISMTEKNTSEANEASEMKTILSKINGYDYMRLCESLEKKFVKKAKEEKVAAPSDEIVPEVGPLPEAKPEVKEEVKIDDVKPEPVVEPAVTEKKKVEVTVGDDNKIKIETPTSEVSVKAIFNKADEITKSTWALVDGDKNLVQATLADIWEEADFKDEKHMQWATSSEYGDALVARFKEIGLEKTAELLGVGKPVTKTALSELTAREKVSVALTATKLKKNADKLPKAIYVDPGMNGEFEVMTSLNDFQGWSTGVSYKDQKKAIQVAQALAQLLGVPFREQETKKASLEFSLHKVAGVWAVPNTSSRATKLKQMIDALDPAQKYNIDDISKQFWNFIGDDDFWDQVDRFRKGEVEGKETGTISGEKFKALAMKKLEQWSKLPKEEWATRIDPKVWDILLNNTKKAEDTPMVEAKVETPAEEPKIEASVETVASAFDKLKEKIILGQGFEAHKDVESKEVVVTDKDGKEVKRLPDGFGDDVPTIIKLLQAVMGIKLEDDKEKEEVKPEVKEEPKPEPKEEVKEEPKEEPKEFPKEKEASKEEISLQKRAADLEKKEAELTAREEKLASNKFGQAVKARTERCKTIVESMLERGMIEAQDADINAALEEDMELLAAREQALQVAINRQMRDLVAMDDASLEKFAESVTRVKKTAGQNKVAKPLHITFEEPASFEKEIADIFSTMGTLGKKPK